MSDTGEQVLEKQTFEEWLNSLKDFYETEDIYSLVVKQDEQIRSLQTMVMKNIAETMGEIMSPASFNSALEALK